MAALETALGAAGARLEENSWAEAAAAILTTDRFPKTAVRRLRLGADDVVLQGMTKGNTMMAPNMATTLSFLFTDAALPGAVLGPLLRGAVERTYNRITVDNTQSTNDTMLLFATGAASGRPEVDDAAAPELRAFAAALEDLLAELAGLIIEDAAAEDGIIVEITVSGAESEAAAARMARRVADSYLVRRDVAGGREMMPGRIIAAVGMAEERVAQARLGLSIGGEVVGREGGIVGSAIIDPGPLIQDRRLRIAVDVGVGGAAATVYTVVAEA
jgi:glutamate N-acetyltransferase/amino-acid N-acetyltransferase